MRHAGQRASAHLSRIPQAPPEHEYAFLVGTLIDQATLHRAEREATQCGVATHEVLLAAGWVTHADYAVALAGALGVPLAPWHVEIDLGTEAPETATEAGVPARLDGQPCHILSATPAAPTTLRSQLAALQERGIEVVLAPRHLLDAALEAREQPACIDRAARGLLRERPLSSAFTSASTWQILAGAASGGLVIGGLAVLPDATFAALTGLMALSFLCVTLLRVVALRQALAGPARTTRRARLRSRRLPDRLLPIYTVLVPLLREANMLADLIRSLRALDYPPAKLEILLVLEALDTETRATLMGLELPGNVRVLVVPDQGPRTKPKALNYALQFARGDYVVVYDAEDRPQAGQLRHAVDVFRQSPPGLGCLQAQLNIYNPSQSWLTRGLMAQIAEA